MIYCTYYSTSPAFLTLRTDAFYMNTSTCFDLGLLDSTAEGTHSPFCFPEVTHNGWKSVRQRVRGWCGQEQRIEAFLHKWEQLSNRSLLSGPQDRIMFIMAIQGYAMRSPQRTPY